MHAAVRISPIIFCRSIGTVSQSGQVDFQRVHGAKKGHDWRIYATHSKEEYRAYLIAAMKTCRQIGPDHQFCQICKVVDENGVTREFRMPDIGYKSL